MAMPSRFALQGVFMLWFVKVRSPSLQGSILRNRLPKSTISRRCSRTSFMTPPQNSLPWLDKAPQTNEVARSAVLYPGLMTITQLTGKPLALFEIGSSAGLNLVLDRYAYTLGGEVVGNAASRLHLRPNWEGPPPSGGSPKIVQRRGCDLFPVDLSRNEDRERLIAYVWPDQTERLNRLAIAIDITALDPPQIDVGDAAEWIAQTLEADRSTGLTRVLMHSIMFGYLSRDTQQRITALMDVIGSRADANSPVAWLALELEGDSGPALTLRIWPGGSKRVLARADAHGHNIVWNGV